MHCSQILLTGMFAALSLGSPVKKPSGTPAITAATTAWGNSSYIYTGVGPVSTNIPPANASKHSSYIYTGVGPVSTNIPAVTASRHSSYIDTGVGPVSIDIPPATAITTRQRRQIVASPSVALWGNLSTIVAQNVSVSTNITPTIVAEAGITLAASNSPVRHDRTVTASVTSTVQNILIPTATQAMTPICFDQDGNGFKGYFFRLKHFATEAEASRLKEAAINFWIGDRVYPGPFRPQRHREVLIESVYYEEESGTWACEVTLTQEFFAKHIARGNFWVNGWLETVVRREMRVSPLIVPSQMFVRNACWNPERCEIDGGKWANVMEGDFDKKACMRPCREDEKKVEAVVDGKRYCRSKSEVIVPR